MRMSSQRLVHKTEGSWHSVVIEVVRRALGRWKCLSQVGYVGIARKTVVYGAFKGMGDLLCAAPVIESELNAGVNVVLLVFPSLRAFVDLVEFGPNRDSLRVVCLPVPFRLESLRAYIAEVKDIAPELVWYSPHSPLPVSSWRIPLLLSVVKLRYWPDAKFAGADSERLSWLFDIRLPVDRSLPYGSREQTAYAMLDSGEIRRSVPTVRFVNRIQHIREAPPTYDLAIHPGASADNRKWPFNHYQSLLSGLPSHWRIAIVGLPADVAAIRRELNEDGRIEFVVGSLEDAIACIARSRFALTMDSGPMFFAKTLGVPVLTLFGPSDPGRVVESSATVSQIFHQQWSCQPCMNETCRHGDVRCMKSIEPSSVLSVIMRRVT